MRTLWSVPTQDELVEDPLASPIGPIRKTRQRMLRTYRRHAMETHDCDKCCGQIESGERYEGRVEIDAKGRLQVWKEHVEPSCDWPTEPDDTDKETRQAEDGLSRAA